MNNKLTGTLTLIYFGHVRLIIRNLQWKIFSLEIPWQYSLGSFSSVNHLICQHCFFVCPRLEFFHLIFLAHRNPKEILFLKCVCIDALLDFLSFNTNSFNILSGFFFFFYYFCYSVTNAFSRENYKIIHLNFIFSLILALILKWFWSLLLYKGNSKKENTNFYM